MKRLPGSGWKVASMFMSARIAELDIRRNRRVVRHTPRRGHNLTEPSTGGDVVHVLPARPPVLIALIDPKPLTRESILKMLKASLPENVKLQGVSCFDELLDSSSINDEFVEKEARMLIILYIRNAGVADNWVQEQLRLIKSRQPKMPVIMISDRDDADDVMYALSCGVRGYIPTSIAAEVAIAALTLVEAGGTYIPAGALLPERRGALENPEKDGQTQLLADELNLTSRELAVIDLLREGNANKVIAKRLDMRESTVKVHVRNILKKLRATNRTHAATVANRLLAAAANDLH
jgi:DNA-binding NarL/FixJ family response regulator